MDEWFRWMTIAEIQDKLSISRQHVYTLADRYQWRTAKRGSSRFFHRDDVEATPPADERQRLGYEDRTSTHVDISKKEIEG